MMRTTDAANFFIYVSNQDDDENFITNLKLNKLLYYAQGCHLTRTGKPLFNSDIEAWTYGPVVSEIYKKYKVCGKEAIRNADDDFNPADIDEEELETLLDVMREYGKYTGSALITMTHKADTPWSIARASAETIISEDSMRKYFEKNPVKHLSVSAPIVDKLPNDWYDSSEDAEWEAYLD